MEEPDTRAYESSCAVTDALAQESRLDFGLRENVRADEKLTAFVNWKGRFAPEIRGDEQKAVKNVTTTNP